MAKTVEIIGPSGSGKSSIYHQLRSSWREEFNWVAYDDLSRSSKQMRKRYLRKALKLLTDRLPIGKQSKNNTLANEEWRFINHDNRIFLNDENAEFKKVIMDLVEDHCKEWYDGSDKRFVTIHMIMWSIAHIDRVLTAKNDQRYCILKQGEGFVSRIMHLNSPSFDEEALNKYLEHLLFPDTLILLDVPVDEILKRIKNRDRMATLHKDMDDAAIRHYTEQTIRYFKIAMDIAREKGVDVHLVNAGNSLDQTTSQIVDILAKKKRIG